MEKDETTVVCIVCYRYLMGKYENPIEHAGNLHEGQVFVANGWQKPEGLCDNARKSMSAFVMRMALQRGKFLRRLDEESEVRHNFLHRRFPAGEISHRK